MRYEDWTFREAEVRLGEHRELRQALGLASVPDFTIPFSAASERCDYRPRGGRDGAPVAREAQKKPTESPRGRRRHWLGAGRGQHVLRAAHASSRTKATAVEALVEMGGRGGHGSAVLARADCAAWSLERLCKFACRRPDGFSANADRSGAGRCRVRQQRNHTYIRPQLGAQSVIPAKRGKKTWHIHGVRAEMRRSFPRQLYRRRALIETLFSSVKRKLSARAPGRTLPMQKRQALLLGLSFNLYRLRHRYLFTRMSTEPDGF